MIHYIGIDEAAEIMFEKCMKIPDILIHDYFRLTTDIPSKIYEPLISSDIREAHFKYAREIVRMYHGINRVIDAENRYQEIAAGKLPENIDEFKIDTNGIGIVDLLKTIGFAASNSDARRLITGGGIKINGETVTDNFLAISNVKEIVISRGKNKYVRIFFDSNNALDNMIEHEKV